MATKITVTNMKAWEMQGLIREGWLLAGRDPKTKAYIWEHSGI